MTGIELYDRSSPINPGPTCVDVFAGAGGLAEGFRQAGWSILAGNDLDTAAGETFLLNFPEAAFFQGTISLLKAKDVLEVCGLARGELDCLIGGPPCQSFSYNNHQRNAHDDRARLFDQYLKLVRGLLPKTLVMENVPGILTINGGSVLAEIKTKLRKLGYDVEVNVLSAEQYGTPQVRRRVFIMATRIGVAKTMLPAPTHMAYRREGQSSEQLDLLSGGGRKKLKPWVTVDDAIGDLPEIENGGGQQVAKYSPVKPFSDFQKAMKKGSKLLFNHVCHNLTSVNLNRMKHVPEGGNWRDIPFDLLTAGMKRAKPTDHTKRYGRLARNGLASTLLTKCDPHWGAYVHPQQDRTISVREAARLQGFPDRFQFAGAAIGQHYEQVGNAVPVTVARAIGAAVSSHVDEDRYAVLDAAE